MERQRSFSGKSSKFLLFSLTVSSSLVFVIYFSVWLLGITPPTRQATPHLQFKATPLALTSNPINAQELTGFSGNISAKGSILVDTLPLEPGSISWNASSSPGLSTSSEIQGEDESELLEDEGGDIVDDADGDANSTSPMNTVSEKLSEIESDGASASQEVEQTNSTVISFEQIGVGRTVNGEVEERREKASILPQNKFSISEENGAKSSGGCDLTNGKWVYDESYPLYTNRSCPFIDEGFNCEGNGRTDKDYMKWRWQPHYCEIPRFNATNMLELIRGKRLVFVGDSINRNQWESMLCLLMRAVRDPKRVYETRHRKITKGRGNYCFRFVDYSCTVEYYVTHFLVHESKARVGKKRVQTLRIDTMDHGSSRWRRADILVFNTAHWWSHHKTKAGINYYQEGSQVHPKLDVLTAFRKALMTWASWVDKQIDPARTRVFFRSSAPSHFRGGQWNSGGHCRESTWPLTTSLSNYEHSWKTVILDDVLRHMKTPVTMLNITGLSEYRVDGHPSIYGGRSGKGHSSSIEDCSHWCLPGVPDTWNELLYMHLQSKQHGAL